MKHIFSIQKILLILLIVSSFDSFAQCINGSLISIRSRRSGNYEYVIFTFKGKTAPSFKIKSVNPPFTNYGDEPVNVKGCKFKQINFQGAVYCTVKKVTSSLNVFKDIQNTEQFEGYYEYIMGLRCKQSQMIQYQYRAGKYSKRVIRLKK